MRRFDHHEPTARPGRIDAAGALQRACHADEDLAGEGNGEAFPAPPSALTVDWKLFEHHLADEDLTEQEKREFIEALWYIVVSFVDLGFGIEPVNQALRAAALDNPQPANPAAETAADSGACKQPSSTAAITATNTEESDRKERSP